MARKISVFMVFVMIFSSIMILNPFSTNYSYAVETGSSQMTGGYVKFGKYKGYDLEWIVVDSNLERTILMATRAVDEIPFHQTDNNHIFWEGSYARSWLNGTFYNLAFNSKEKASLIQGIRTLKPNNKTIGRYFHDNKLNDDYNFNLIWWNNNTQVYNDYVVLPSAYENYLLDSYSGLEGKLLDGTDYSRFEAYTRDYGYDDDYSKDYFMPMDIIDYFHAPWTNQIFKYPGSIRPVIYLKSGIKMGGTGIKTNPYKLVTNVPPILNSISNPSSNTQLISGSTLSVNGSLKDEDIGQAIDVQYRINSGSWVDLTTVTATGSNQSFTGSLTLTGLAEGNHNISFRALDSDSEASNIITVSIEVVSILKEVNDKIINYLPPGQNQDNKIVAVNTDDPINNNTTNNTLINTIKTNLNNRDVDGLYFIGQGGTYIQTNLTNPYKDSKANYSTSVNIPSMVEYVTETSKKVNKEPSNKLAVSEFITAYINSYEMDFYDIEKDYYGISISDKLGTVELERAKRQPNPYGYYYNGEYYPLRVKYEHNHTYYDVPASTQHTRGNGDWLYVKDLSTDPNIITEFTQDMRGEWKLYVQAYDYTGRTVNEKDVYDKESDVNDYYTFLVHNYPTARIYKTSEVGTTVNLSGEHSFDIDYVISEDNNGIQSYSWKGQARSDNTWTDLGTGKTVSVNKSIYKAVELKVTDFDGVSSTTLMDIDHIETIVVEPEPDFAYPNELFIGTHGSDKLSVSNISKNKELITSGTYTFGFSSSNGYLNTANSTSTTSITTFEENTLKYDGKLSTLATNPKTIKLSVNSSTSSNIQSPSKTIKFIPVSITNIEIEPNSYFISGDKFDVVITTTNAKSGPQEMFVKIEGDSNSYRANYEGSNKWRITLAAPSTTGANTIVEFKIDAMVRQADNSNVIYDRTDVDVSGNATNDRGKKVKVLNTQLDFTYLAKRYNEGSKETILSHNNSFYAYLGEKIFLRDAIADTGINTLVRKSIWLNNSNKIGEGKDFEAGFISEGSNTYTQKIEINDTSANKAYEMPQTKDKEITIYPLQIKGEHPDTWNFGSTRSVKAKVGPTANIINYNDFTVWLKVNLRLKDGTFYKSKIQLDRVGSSNEYTKDLYINKNVTFPDGTTKEVESGGHIIEYLIKSTRSGENDTDKTMHTLASDPHIITTIMPQIISEDMSEYATFQKIIEVEIIGIVDSLNVFAKPEDYPDEIPLTKIGDTKYSFKLPPNSVLSIQKDTKGINIPIVNKKIDYLIKTSDGSQINFLEFNKNGVITNNSDFNFTIITPRFKRNESNELVAINTPKEVKPTDSLLLEVETEQVDSDKFKLVAKSDLFESDLTMDIVEEDLNKFKYSLNPLKNKAGIYTITYQILNKGNNMLVDEVSQDITIKADLFNPRIIDTETGLFVNTLIPNREYDYLIDSTVNISDVKMKFISEASEAKMEIHEEDNVYNTITWKKTVSKNQTKDISTVKGSIQGKTGDRSVNPNVLILGDTASFAGSSADKNFTKSIDKDIEVKVVIEGNAKGLEKKIHTDNPVPIDTIPAGETLIIKDMQVVTNVELDTSGLELSIPINRYQTGSTILSKNITVNDSLQVPVAAETSYVYNLGDIEINLPKETLDDDYKVYIKASTVNGSNNTIEIANFRVSTPIDLVPKMPSTIIATTTAEIKATTSKYVNSVTVDVFSNGAYVLNMIKDGGVYKEDGKHKQNWKVNFTVPTGLLEGEYTAKFIAKTPNNKSETKTQKFTLINVKLDNFRAITVYDIRWKDMFVNSSNKRTGYVIPKEAMPVINQVGHPIRLGYKLEFEIDSIGLDKTLSPTDNVYVNVTLKGSNGNNITSSLPVNYRNIGKTNSKFKTSFKGNSTNGTWKFEYYIPSDLINKASNTYVDIEFEIIAAKQGRDVYNYNILGGFNGKTFRYDTTKTAEDDYYIQSGN